MPNLHERMLPGVRIEPSTVRIPGGRASDRATTPGNMVDALLQGDNNNGNNNNDKTKYMSYEDSPGSATIIEHQRHQDTSVYRVNSVYVTKLQKQFFPERNLHSDQAY